MNSNGKHLSHFLQLVELFNFIYEVWYFESLKISYKTIKNVYFFTHRKKIKLKYFNKEKNYFTNNKQSIYHSKTFSATDHFM